MKKYVATRNFYGGSVYPSALAKGQEVELPDELARKWLVMGWIVHKPKGRKKKVVIK